MSPEVMQYEVRRTTDEAFVQGKVKPVYNLSYKTSFQFTEKNGDRKISVMRKKWAIQCEILKR